MNFNLNSFRYHNNYYGKIHFNVQLEIGFHINGSNFNDYIEIHFRGIIEEKNLQHLKYFNVAIKALDEAPYP